MHFPRELANMLLSPLAKPAIRIFAVSILDFAFPGHQRELGKDKRRGNRVRKGGRGWPRRHNCTIVNCPPLAKQGDNDETGNLLVSMPSSVEEVAFLFFTLLFSLSDCRAADLLSVVRLRDFAAGLPAVPGPPEEPRPRARRLPPRGRQRQEDLRVQVLQRRTGM